MSLKLYFHPLASFCHKALVALYENETPFEGQLVELADASQRAAFLKVWPIGKFPVLRDEARAKTVPEATVIIEYLAQYYPGRVELVPQDPELAWQVRLQDRFYDLYVNEPMGKIVTDRLRPAGRNDPQGVESARALLLTAYGIIEERLASSTWAVGEAFSMADCAAAPALFYANLVQPFGANYPHAASYLERLQARPSFARVLREAEPYFALMPK